MTKQEAIKDIQDNIKPIVGGKSLDMAIEALTHFNSDSNSIKNELNDDLISRQDAIDALSIYGDKLTLDNVAERIYGLPSAQPEQRTGRWLPDNNSVYEMRFICSECKESHVVPTIGFTTYKPIWDFCPNCGARMRGDTNG